MAERTVAETAIGAGAGAGEAGGMGAGGAGWGARGEAGGKAADPLEEQRRHEAAEAGGLG